MTEDDYQDAIDLTHKQELAFNALVRAVKRCESENIYFYQCLEKLNALNGNNVLAVTDDGGDFDSPNCLQALGCPSVETACSFADDSHYVELHHDYAPIA